MSNQGFGVTVHIGEISCILVRSIPLSALGGCSKGLGNVEGVVKLRLGQEVHGPASSQLEWEPSRPTRKASQEKETMDSFLLSFLVDTVFAQGPLRASWHFSSLLHIKRQRVSQQITLRLLQVRRVRKRHVKNAERRSCIRRHVFPKPILDQRLARVGIPSCDQVCKRWVRVKRPRERGPDVHGNLRQNEIIPVAEWKRRLTQGTKHVVQFARVTSERFL